MDSALGLLRTSLLALWEASCRQRTTAFVAAGRARLRRHLRSATNEVLLNRERLPDLGLVGGDLHVVSQIPGASEVLAFCRVGSAHDAVQPAPLHAPSAHDTRLEQQVVGRSPMRGWDQLLRAMGPEPEPGGTESQPAAIDAGNRHRGRSPAGRAPRADAGLEQLAHGEQTTFLSNPDLGLSPAASSAAIARLEQKVLRAGKPSLESWLLEALPGVPREQLTREQVGQLTAEVNRLLRSARS